MSDDPQEIDPAIAAALLGQLRWREDMIITNHFGAVVWLRPLYVDTDCCLAESPCEIL